MSADDRPTIEWDDDRGAVVIAGVRYAYGYFNALGSLPVPSFIRIDARHDGTLTVTMFSPALQADFAKAAGLRP